MIIADKNVQCSVCMEDFKLEETVKELPCSHLYHPDCIVPWLEMVSTEDHLPFVTFSVASKIYY